MADVLDLVALIVLEIVLANAVLYAVMDVHTHVNIAVLGLQAEENEFD